jgi:hypothetical protein
MFEAVDSNFKQPDAPTIVGGTSPSRTAYVPNTAFIMMWMEKAHP